MSGYRHNPYTEKTGAGVRGAEPFPSGEEGMSSDGPDPRLLAFRKAEADKMRLVFDGTINPTQSPSASMNEGVSTSYGHLPYAISPSNGGRIEGTLSPNGTFASDMPLLGTFSAPPPDQTSPSRSGSPGYRHNPYGDKHGEHGDVGIMPNSTFGSEGLSPPINPAVLTAMTTATFSSDMMPVLGTFSDGRQSPGGLGYTGSPPPPMNAQEMFMTGGEQPDPRLFEFQARARAQAEAMDVPPSLDNTFNSDAPFRTHAPPLIIPSSRDSSPYNSFSNNSFSHPPFLPTAPGMVSPCLSPVHNEENPNELCIIVHRDPNEKFGLKWATKYLQVAAVKPGTPGCNAGIERAVGKTLTHVNDMPVNTTKDFLTRVAGQSVVKLLFSSADRTKRQQKGLYSRVDSPMNSEGPLRVPPAPPLPPQLADQAPAAELPTAVTILFKYGRRAEFATPMSVDEARRVQGEYWLVEAAKGVDLGLVSAARPNNDDSRVPQYRLVRSAGLDEIRLWENDRVEEEGRALAFVVDKARKLKAPVTVHRTEFQYDRLKLTIHYSSAVNKPDFRQLLHDSFREFKCRIWMNNCQPAPGQPGDSLDLEAPILPRQKMT